MQPSPATSSCADHETNSESSGASELAAESAAGSSSFLAQILRASDNAKPTPVGDLGSLDIRPRWLIDDHQEWRLDEHHEWQRVSAGQASATGADAAATDSGVADAPAADLPTPLPVVDVASATSLEEPEAPPHTAVFVHFMPPPLRANNKKDLSWIVHTCDGSGCHEARHVQFNSICGFSTYEGQPPEQAQGLACSCTIANHHLRGYGRVRWEGTLAIIEHHGGGSGGAMVNVRAFKEESRKQAAQLARTREELKRVREASTSAARMVDELVIAKDEQETAHIREVTVLKAKRTAADLHARKLALELEALKAAHEQRSAAAAQRPARPPPPPPPPPPADDDEEDTKGSSSTHLNLGRWRCVLVCLPPPRAAGMV